MKIYRPAGCHICERQNKMLSSQALLQGISVLRTDKIIQTENNKIKCQRSHNCAWLQG